MGMEPGKTSFVQALGIPTKFAGGTMEIVSDVQVVTAGTRVGPSLHRPLGNQRS